jgi:putative FmdB family regulatory protein
VPLYEYECGKCAHRFELRRRFGEDGDATCPVCSGQSRRVFCPVPIVFKGSGFYVTDYRKDKDKSESTDKPAAETKPAEKKTETKSETKATSVANAKT